MVLNEYELRVLGALVEKQIATPDYYPMTLNALTNACNQKNHRDPVTSFDDQTVMRALESLREKNLAYVFHGSDARVPKYGHTFAKYFDFTSQELAVMTVLILRGPQTPGELRSRSGHLFNFDNLPEVETTVQSLATRSEPLVVKLPRLPGTKESRFTHLLAGEINFEELAAASESAPSRSGRSDDARIAKLEIEVEELRQGLASLQAQFAEFKKQFE
jgi:uncharacterized protein YceH (UPF0502 family)